MFNAYKDCIKPFFHLSYAFEFTFSIYMVIFVDKKVMYEKIEYINSAEIIYSEKVDGKRKLFFIRFFVASRVFTLLMKTWEIPVDVEKF